MQALVDALVATACECTDHGLLTTPQLHYLVRCINTQGTPQTYGVASEKGYYEKLGQAFARAIKGRKVTGGVTVDCANGVGGGKLRELLKYLPSVAEGGVEMHIVNDDVLNPDTLNHQVCRAQAALVATGRC